MKPVTATLAEAASRYRFDALPQHVVRVAQACILDWLGVATAAANETGIAAARRALGGSGSATLLGSADRTAVPMAARINGTAGHILDFDDVHDAFSGHPTAPVLPAVLALAESRGASGKDVIAAFVAGVETESRISPALAPSHYAMGFHTTATIGTFGAAAACGNMLRLNDETMDRALGLASLSAAGLKSGFGSDGKSLQVGHAAQEGLVVATLAANGATGPQHALEHKLGFARTHSNTVDFDAAIVPPRDLWHTKKMGFKYYASCYGTHSNIAALLRLRDRAPDSDVAGIDLTIAPKHVGMCTQENVTTPLEAKFSVAFTSAMAWLHGSADRVDFTDDIVNDPALQELSKKVTTVVEQDRDFATTDVRVRFSDGTVLHDAVDMGKIAAEDELDDQWERLATKFRSLMMPEVGERQTGHLIDLVGRLPELDHVGELLAATRPAAG